MSKMFFATTRFTDKTARENHAFLTRVDKLGTCIIGSNQPISEKIPQGALVIVVMMHIADETQKKNKQIRESNDYVSGICLVENIHRPDRYCSIYDEIEYNQVTYLGQDPISREELCSFNPLLIEVLDIILFKGNSHQKRCKYITELKDEFLENVKGVKNKENVFLLPRQELRDLNVKQSILDIYKHKSFAMTAHLQQAPEVQQAPEAQPLDEELLFMLNETSDYYVKPFQGAAVCQEEASSGKRVFVEEEEEEDDELLSLLLEYCPNDFEPPPFKRLQQTAFYNGFEIEAACV